MKLKLNLKKWNVERLEIEGEISRLKNILHTPGHMGTTTEWLTLFDLDDKATRLYMLRAETRGEGRLHMTQRLKYTTVGNGTPSNPHVTRRELVPVTREDQRKAIAGLLPLPDAIPDEKGEIGLFCVCEPPRTEVTITAQ